MRLLHAVVSCVVVLCTSSKIVIDDDLDKGNPLYDAKEKVTRINVSAEAGKELKQHWVDQAFSGLMAAVAMQKMATLKDEHKDTVHECSKKAHSIQEHAQCVAHAIELAKDRKNLHSDERQGATKRDLRSKSKFRTNVTVKRSGASGSSKKHLKNHNQPSNVDKRNKTKNKQQTKPVKRFHGISVEARRLSEEKIGKKSHSKRSSNMLKTARRKKLSQLHERTSSGSFARRKKDQGDSEWVGAFKIPKRSKREIENRASYALPHELDKSPFGAIASHLANALHSLKQDLLHKPDGEKKSTNWRTLVAEIEDKGKEIKMKRRMRKIMQKHMESYSKVAKEGDIEVDEHRPLAMKELEDLEDDDEEKAELMNTLHEKEKNMTFEEKIAQAPIQILREAVKLGMSLNGQNTSDFEKKSVKLLSPRILSLMQDDKDEDEKQNEINLISPNLFSLHGEGDALERNLSLHHALGGIKGDGDNLMNLIIEASGVGDIVKYIKDERLPEAARREEIRGPNGEPLYWTKENVTKHLGDHETKKVEVMEKLTGMYTPNQMQELKSRGYTVLTPRQADHVYGPKSPYNDSAALSRVKRLYGENHVADMISESVDDAISTTIHSVAKGHSKYEARQHDIVLSPVLFANLVLNSPAASQPIVLSPVLLSTLILSPGIFGPIILSPWLFVAAVLSPRLMSPVIVTPFGFVPIILSPFALNPIVLSPGIFNPIVLSPLLMTPFILSPEVCTPVILSPIALSPFILSPTLMSPLVLSPFVLSPLILSPAYVSALIFSPYALSPAIASNGAMVSVIASPSFLS